MPSCIHFKNIVSKRQNNKNKNKMNFVNEIFFLNPQEKSFFRKLEKVKMNN